MEFYNYIDAEPTNALLIHPDIKVTLKLRK